MNSETTNYQPAKSKFIGNECREPNAGHGEFCVNEIHLRGWAVHCECECHTQTVIPFGCADLDTFNTIYGGGRSEFPK